MSAKQASQSTTEKRRRDTGAPPHRERSRATQPLPAARSGLSSRSPLPELTPMPSLDITLDLSREQCIAHYQGQAQRVYARSLDGRRVVFPASALVRVMTHDGVRGRFRLDFSPSGRLLGLVRV